MTETGAGRKRKVILGASSGYLSALITNLLSFITVPIALRYFCHDRYGVWVLVLTLSGYLNIAGLGVPSAALVLSGRMSDSIRQMRITTRAASIVGGVAIVVLTIVLIVGKGKWWLLLLGNVPGGVAGEACRAAFYTFVFAAVNLPLAVFTSGFIGIQKPHLEQAYFTLMSNAYVVALLTTIYGKGDLVDLAQLRGWLCVGVCLAGAIHFAMCCKGADMSLGQALRIAACSRDEQDPSARVLLSNGRHFLASGMAVMVIQQSDTVIISHILGVSSVTPYQVTFRLVTLGFILFNAFNTSFLPLYGSAWVRQEHKWIEKSANTMLRLSPALGGLVWIAAAAFAEPVIAAWAGPAAYAGTLTVLALGGFGYMQSVSNQLYILLSSQNQIRKIPVIRWVEAGSNLLLSIVLVKMIGIAGAAIGSGVAILLTVLWLLPREVNTHTTGRIAVRYRPVFTHFWMFIVPSLLATLAINVTMVNFAMRMVLNLAVIGFYVFFSLRHVPEMSDLLTKGPPKQTTKSLAEADPWKQL